MLEPLKFLDKLWDKIEKSGIARKRKDFLQTVLVLGAVGYLFCIPLMLLVAKQVADLVEHAMNIP